MKNNIILILILTALLFFSSCAKEKRQLREGNDYYKESNYTEAENQYRKALVVDSNYLKAQYNLANANYKQQTQEKLQTALRYYENYLKGNSYNDTINNANTIYNRGNVNFQLFNSDTTMEPSMKIKYLQQALEDYKQTLRLNPQDSAAKYNLALTQYLLNKNQDQQQNQNQQQNQQQQQQQQQQDQKQEKQENENTPAQPKRMKDKKETERMLEALKNNEKNTLEKVKKKEEQQVQKRYIEKDW
jgi:tetratricopeptide (TPR) repeat protein